jgi:hypothetical protein
MTRDTRRLERRSHPSRPAYTLSTCSALMHAVSPRTTVVTSASIRDSAGPVATCCAGWLHHILGVGIPTSSLQMSDDISKERGSHSTALTTMYCSNRGCAVGKAVPSFSQQVCIRSGRTIAAKEHGGLIRRRHIAALICRRDAQAGCDEEPLQRI